MATSCSGSSRGFRAISSRGSRAARSTDQRGAIPSGSAPMSRLSRTFAVPARHHEGVYRALWRTLDGMCVLTENLAASKSLVGVGSVNILIGDFVVRSRCHCCLPAAPIADHFDSSLVMLCLYFSNLWTDTLACPQRRYCFLLWQTPCVLSRNRFASPPLSRRSLLPCPTLPKRNRRRVKRRVSSVWKCLSPDRSSRRMLMHHCCEPILALSH